MSLQQPPCWTILVVDDNLINQQVLEGLLEMQGHKPFIADDGAVAVAMVAAGKYDLVLMDVQMPGMDGLTATGEIRKLPAPRNHVPIIAVTASAEAADSAACLAAGMDDYLCKPVNRRSLAALLERWAERLAVTGQV